MKIFCQRFCYITIIFEGIWNTDIALFQIRYIGKIQGIQSFIGFEIDGLDDVIKFSFGNSGQPYVLHFDFYHLNIP